MWSGASTEPVGAGSAGVDFSELMVRSAEMIANAAGAAATSATVEITPDTTPDTV